MKKSTKEREEALARLREWLKPGDTVYTILRHVSKSGMSRDIGIVIFRDGSPLHPNHAVACVLGLTLKRDAVRINGCGMDMGFEIVYNLCQCVFPGKRPSSALKHEWL